MRLRLISLGFICLTTSFLIVGCNYNTSTPADDKKDPYYMKAMDQIQRKDYAGAAESLRRVLDGSPRNAAAHKELGIINEDHYRDYVTAVYHYRNYLKLNDKEDDPLIKSRVTECMRELITQSDINPDSPAYQKKLDQLLKDKQSLEDSVTKLTVAYEQLRSDYTNLLAKLQQQDIALARAQASLGTNAAAINRPVVSNLNTEMLTVNVPTNPVPPVELPKTQKKIEIYEIQSGDTFAKLARRYNVKPDDLIKLNPDANPNNLKIGQEIKIPVQ